MRVKRVKLFLRQDYINSFSSEKLTSNGISFTVIFLHDFTHSVVAFSI